MKIVRGFLAEIWEAVREMLLTIAIVLVIILVIVAYFKEKVQVDADTVTIKYVEDSAAYRKPGYTRIIASTDPKMVKDWLKLMNKSIPKREWTQFEALKKNSFPMYIVEFRQNRNLKTRFYVCGTETVLKDFYNGLIQRVEYESGNPYHQKAARLMEKMETAAGIDSSIPVQSEPASSTVSTAQLTLSDTFQNLLDEVNASHAKIKLYDREYEPYTVWYQDSEFIFSRYNYMPNEYPALETVLTMAQVIEDMELYYTALRTQYGGYSYFGGDEVFRAAIDAVIADCEALETVTYGDLRSSLVKRFAFVKDAHFSFGGSRAGEFPVPFFYRDVPYQKTARGYETFDGKMVASVEGYNDLDDIFKRSLTLEGDLVYYPIRLEAFPMKDLLSGSVTSSTPTLAVYYTDGSTDQVSTLPYTMP
ncbi:MAG: hypothetical protein IKC03_05640, partial [Oscillospiraceae bacterium]|nr:hypothetical protein [Oscillospiraceae bacterium]